MQNFIIAWKLREIGDLLELLGRNSFKVRAYRRAAESLEQLEEELEEFWRQGRLTEISAIGKSIANQVEELLATGESQLLKELRADAPFSELLSIPNLGPKLAKKLHDFLGINNFSELKAALEAHKIREIPGLSVRTERNLSRNLKQMSSQEGKTLLGIVLPFARQLLARLQLVADVQKVDIVGSTRRYVEAVSDLDLLVKTTHPEKVIEFFVNIPECQKILEKSMTRVVIQTRQGILVELITAKPADYSLMLFLTTGKAHIKQVKEVATNKGWKCVNEWSDTQGKPLVFAAEEDIYHQLDMSFIIPELREGQGEVQAALEGWLPQSVELKDIKGDLHLHTRWSDGINSIEEMVQKGKSLGYQYLAVCDHSRSLKIAKGMSIEVLEEQIKVIDDLNSTLTGFHILKGIEVDILKDGQLDYPDEILARLDLVVASIHTGFRASAKELTKRVVTAMRNPHVNIIAHPTGRLIQWRQPYPIEIERVIEVAAETKTVLEINATPDRLDLSARYLKICKAAGVKIAVNSDAHSCEQMDYMDYGVGMARRGWLETADLINTYSLDQLLAFFEIKR